MSATGSTEWAWLGLGSNLGNRGRALACLRAALSAHGVVVAGVSSEVLTRPVGVSAQGDFHNQVVLARSAEPWTPGGWLRACAAAEEACGRRRSYRWGPRSADADVLLLGRRGELRSGADPRVPHPELPNRAFWSRLITEIDPSVKV